MPRCKVRYFGPALSSKLWPGLRGDAVIVGASYSSVTQMVELIVEGSALPDAEHAHPQTTETVETRFHRRDRP